MASPPNPFQIDLQRPVPEYATHGSIPETCTEASSPLLLVDVTHPRMPSVEDLWKDRLKDPYLWDCDIVTTDGYKIPANRKDLCLMSPAFDKMLRGCFSERQSKAIKLEDVDGTTVENIIGSFYTGQLAIDGDSLLSLVRYADFMELKYVLEACTAYMHRTLSMSTALKYFQLCSECSSSLGDVQFIVAFLARNVSSIIEMGVLGQLPADCLAQMLSRDDLAIQNEMEVVNIIQAWLSEQDSAPQGRNIPAGKDSEDLFRTIRLDVLTMDQLARLRGPEFTDSTELLQRVAEEVLQREQRGSISSPPPPRSRWDHVHVVAKPVIRRVAYDLCFSVDQVHLNEDYTLHFYDHAGLKWKICWTCVKPLPNLDVYMKHRGTMPKRMDAKLASLVPSDKAIQVTCIICIFCGQLGHPVEELARFEETCKLDTYSKRVSTLEKEARTRWSNHMKHCGPAYHIAVRIRQHGAGSEEEEKVEGEEEDDEEEKHVDPAGIASPPSPSSMGLQRPVPGNDTHVSKPEICTEASSPVLVVDVLHPRMPGSEDLWNNRLKEPFLWDCVLVTSDGSKIPASRKDLCLMCPAFNTMVRSGFCQSGVSKPQQKAIKLDGIAGSILEKIIGCFYTGKLAINGESLLPLITYARRQQLKHVLGACTAYMQKTVSVSNALEYFQL